MKILINLVLNKFYREYARILPNPILNIKTLVIFLVDNIELTAGICYFSCFNKCR